MPCRTPLSAPLLRPERRAASATSAATERRMPGCAWLSVWGVLLPRRPWCMWGIEKRICSPFFRPAWPLARIFSCGPLRTGAPGPKSSRSSICLRACGRGRPKRANRLRSLGRMDEPRARLRSTWPLGLSRSCHPAGRSAIETDLLAVVAAQAGQAPARMTPGAFWQAVAQMGGYLARHGDGPPGWKTLWKGWLRVQTLLEGVHLAFHLRL